MISVILPTFNEQKALPETLRALFKQAGDYEVILVDGGSQDATLAIAKSDARLCVLTGPAGRAKQMNQGAQKATGEWLLFLHADTTLPDNALLRIASLSSQIQAGGFHHQFSGDTWGLRFISWLHNKRCAMTNVFYGDQALFVRKDLFDFLGGFPDEPILEDVLFGEVLREVTAPLFLDACVVSDSRKFEQKGTWKGLWRIIVILTCHELGLPIAAQKFFYAVR